MQGATPRAAGRAGALWALAAYGWWGFVPVYFKALRHVAPLEVIAHRIVWSVVVLALLTTALGRWRAIAEVVRNRRVLALLMFSTVLVAGNWFVFIWAVAHEHVLQASLGYFINPLVSVVLGYTVLRERLTRGEWVSVALAALAVETCLLFPLALAYLANLARSGELAFGSLSPATDLLLAGLGVVTAVPLLCFGLAVGRLRLSTIGVLQYVSPTLQLLLAVAVYHEPFQSAQKAAFLCIWTALAIFTADNLRRAR